MPNIIPAHADHMPSMHRLGLANRDISLGLGVGVLGEGLGIGEDGVPQSEGEGDEQRAQGDTADAEQALGLAEGVDDTLALGGVNGVQGGDSGGAAIDLDREGLVAELLGKVAGEDLGVDGTRDGVAQGGADVVGGQVDTGHDGQVLVLELDLEGGLGGVREHATSDTEDDFGGDDTDLGVAALGVATEVDEETEGDHEETGTGKNDVFEAADLEDDQTHDGADNDTAEGVETADAGGHVDVKVEGNNEHVVEVVSLHVPDEVEHESNAEGGPNTAVAHEAEGNEGVRGPELPEDENGEAAETNDKGSDDAGRLPAVGGGEGEGDQDEVEYGDDENDAGDVEQPEQLDEEVAHAQALEGGLVVGEETLLLGAAGDEQEGDDEGKAAHGVDDAPHGITPVDGGAGQDGGGNVTTGPGVDDEGQGRDVGEEETSTGRGDIGDQDLDQEGDHGVSDLVDGRAGREGGYIGRGGEDDGADNVEDDAGEDELNTAEDIGDLSGSGLGGSTNDGADDIDGRDQSLGAEFTGGVVLVGVAEGAVETVAVGDEEDAEEDDDAVGQGQDGGHGLDAADTGRLEALEALHGVGSALLSDHRVLLIVCWRDGLRGAVGHFALAHGWRLCLGAQDSNGRIKMVGEGGISIKCRGEERKDRSVWLY
ncbi:unnamed protein product [Clonostachys rosea]|uniref:Uncharacterized protein n=1 Tax=Bionectria ochroleuca TaxID=29856 RepID=A0ABY6TTI6_BIOOC|nr:unnamed protein product [Clonostachys rosea]